MVQVPDPSGESIKIPIINDNIETYQLQVAEDTNKKIEKTEEEIKKMSEPE